MNQSNDTSETVRQAKSPSIASNVLSNKRVNRSNIDCRRSLKRAKPNQRESTRVPTVDAMGSLVSADNTSDDSNRQNIPIEVQNQQTFQSNEVPFANEETIETNGVQNQETIQTTGVQYVSTSNERQTIQSNQTSNLSRVCIDLTEEDSVVETNGHESDSEIQCITQVIQNPDLCIIRGFKRNRRPERSRSPNRRREPPIDDIIEIQVDSQLNKTIDSTDQSSSTPRKLIKCPVCLDEYSMFRISGKQLVSTNCGHLFCDLCIKEVIKTSKSCPNCRKKIRTNKSFHPIYL